MITQQLTDTVSASVIYDVYTSLVVFTVVILAALSHHLGTITRFF